MNRLLVCSTASIGLLALVAVGSARGQAAPYRPPVSPYLNLLRQNSNVAINYYDLVRPQFQFGNSIAQLQQTTSQIQASQGTGQEIVGGFPTTGHRFAFLSHRRYFQNTFGGGVTGGQTGAGLSGFRAPAASAAATGVGATVPAVGRR
jgi:hypothetical protein